MAIRGDLGLTLVLNEIAGAPAFPAPGLHHFIILTTSFCGFLRAKRALYPGESAQRAAAMASAPDKAYKGLGMEGFIASWYARQTARDGDEFKRIARRIAAHLSSGARLLEIAPGPGYLALELAKLTGCRITGLDISHAFVRIAAENARKAGVRIDFQHGDAADLPFPADQFDFIVCRAAFKNFTRPLAALDEMRRVLKGGGTALIIDLRKDFSPAAVTDYVKDRGPFSAGVIKLTFHTMLKKRAYTKEAIAELVSRSQFRQGDVRLDPLGFELWLRK
jgi:ubiquinone/menaquinone biosynthesis C-methylase UbiE